MVMLSGTFDHKAKLVGNGTKIAHSGNVYESAVKENSWDAKWRLFPVLKT